jgi:MFS family permease
MTFVWRHAALRALVLTATILNFVFTPLFVLLPFFVRDALHADAASYGFLLGALSAGSIAGMAVAASVPPEGSRRERILTGSFLLLPVLLLALAVSKDVVVALLILFAAGLLSGLINVVVITLVQIESAPEMRGRVLSIVFALAQAAMPVGMVIGGVVADVSGTGVAAILAGFGTVGLLAVARGIRSAPLRALLAGGRTSAAS